MIESREGGGVVEVSRVGVTGDGGEEVMRAAGGGIAGGG